MNDQLQQVLAELLSKAVGGIDAGVGFLHAQLPDVVQQLLMWKLVEAGVKTLVAMAIGILLLVIVRKFVEKLQTLEPNFHNKDARGAYVVGIVACSSVALFITCIGCDDLLRILQIWIAPKIYLIEYAARFAK